MFFMIVAIVAFVAGFAAGAGIRKRKIIKAYEEGYHDAVTYSIDRIEQFIKAENRYNEKN